MPHIRAKEIVYIALYKGNFTRHGGLAANMTRSDRIPAATAAFSVEAEILEARLFRFMFTLKNPRWWKLLVPFTAASQCYGSFGNPIS